MPAPGPGSVVAGGRGMSLRNGAAAKSGVPDVIALLIGTAGVIVAVIIPFAPVWTNSTLVHWPAGGSLPVSTTAQFVPQKPAEVHATVPCSAARPWLQAGERKTLLATNRSGFPSKGLVVSAGRGQVQVALGGFEAMAVAPRDDRCHVRVDSQPSGTRIAIGDQVRQFQGAQYVPEIHAFVTDLPQDQARGISVTARPHVWFENAPTAEKAALIGFDLVLVLASLGLLARCGGRRKPPHRRRPRSSPGRASVLIDAGVVTVLAYWTVVGPLTQDDGFATTTVRNGLVSGDFGNYYRWENASEAPFTLVQHLLEPLVALSAPPPVLRLPSVAAGVILWFVLSRGVLGALLPAMAATWWLRLLTGVVFLTWWLPYDLGVRPEPFLALGITAVFAVLLRAAKARGRQPLLLGVAALIAGLTVSINPVGMLVLAPVLVLAPRLRPALGARERDGPGGWAIAARFSLLACLASTGLVAMFADQSWAGARTATEMHRYFGPNLPWYLELVRYEYLLSYNNEQGNAAKRLPVLLTLALLVPTGILISRGLRKLPGMSEVHLPAGCVLAGLALLWLSPSKWAHHFGALAGLGSAFLVAGTVLLVTAARQRHADRAVVLSGLVGGVLAIAAASVAFAGRNDWYSYSEFGLPWTEGPLTPLNNPVLWAGAVAVAGLILVRASPPSRSLREPLCRVASAAPALVTISASILAVGVLAGSFTVAPFQQAGRYSLASQNWDHLSGGSCGIAEKIVAMPDTPGGALTPLGPPEALDGFGFNTGFQPASPAELTKGSGPAMLWGSDLPQPGWGLNTGTLTSRWFALPPLGPEHDLAVSVAGRTGDGNQVALEFGRSQQGSQAVQPLGQRLLDDSYKDSDRRPAYPLGRVQRVQPQDVPQWRALSVTAAEVPPGADRVRIRAVDATTDRGGWIAVTQPRLRDVIPLTRFLDQHSPALLSTELPWSMPCAHMPRVAHGLAQTPKTLVLPKDGFSGIAEAPFDEEPGGTYAGLRQITTLHEVPTRLTGPEMLPQHANWGHIVLLEHPLVDDDYTAGTVPVRRWGWERTDQGGGLP